MHRRRRTGGGAGLPMAFHVSFKLSLHPATILVQPYTPGLTSSTVPIVSLAGSAYAGDLGPDGERESLIAG